jgi:hypothetical protein
LLLCCEAVTVCKYTNLFQYTKIIFLSANSTKVFFNLIYFMLLIFCLLGGKSAKVQKFFTFFSKNILFVSVFIKI